MDDDLYTIYMHADDIMLYEPDDGGLYEPDEELCEPAP